MSRKHPPQPPRQRWLRWLLLALPLLSLPILYAALGSARSPPPRLGGRQQQHPLLPPPRLAYLITGGPGDGPRIRRLLRALYHPWNYYLVGVAGEEDRADLEAFVRGEEAPRRYGNVRVASPGQWAAISRRGPTELAATLHGAALLLKEFQGWSWFINLSASDYPLMPQDGDCWASQCCSSSAEEGEAGAGAVVAALAMIRTQDQLCDRDADPDEIPGLNVAIEESRNVVPTLSFEDASAWSLKEHAKSTGHPYLDLRGDDVDAGPNSAKSENDEDDGAGNGVKAKAGWEDYSPFH